MLLTPEHVLLAVYQRRLMASLHTEAVDLTLVHHQSVLAVALFMGFGILLPLGLRTGFLRFQVLRDPKQVLSALAIVTSRTLLEEGIFRACLLPHPKVDGPMSPTVFARHAVVPLILFVAAHFLDVREKQQKVLRDPRFLLLTTCMGIATSTLYYVTDGSLAIICAMHGIPVMVWLLLMGGYDKLHK